MRKEPKEEKCSSPVVMVTDSSHSWDSLRVQGLSGRPCDWTVELTCWWAGFPDRRGGVCRGAAGGGVGESRAPGAGRLQPTNRQPGGEGGPGGGSGALHHGNQDAASSAEVRRPGDITPGPGGSKRSRPLVMNNQEMWIIF